MKRGYYLFFLFAVCINFVFASNLGIIEIGIPSSGDMDGPNISLTYPEDNQSLYAGGIYFNFSVNDINSISNCTLAINDENISSSNGLNNSFMGNFFYSLISGDYIWKVFCYDSNNNYNESSSRILSVIESPVSLPSSDSGNGGGGGGGTVLSKKKVYDFNEKVFSVKMQMGSVSEKRVIVHNYLNKDLTINFQPKDIEGFYHSPMSIIIKANSSDFVVFQFVAGKNIDPGVYIGKIISKGGGEEIDLIVSLEISSPESLFDVQANIPPQFKEVKAGERVSAEVELFNFGEKEMVDVIVDYGLKASNGKIILKSQKTIAVKNRASFIVSLDIPKYLQGGDYFLFVDANYEGKTAVASDNLIIKSSQTGLIIKYFLITLLFICIAGIIYGTIYYLIKKYQFVFGAKLIRFMRIEKNNKNKKK